ncbi:uncharacterized protein KY384_005608 [Bacidia gigantensis]|uniref:uncharacterized protein n=1 Tax=Bacidia gigantensis TaxID=2732470 RepID=UPI001D04BF11|nr:uncharacterized protein KY384_005608 [Bacidia gigantensis]KAG8530125.1 hypothetical protein KY384_005608 [Bacidia gigantensis]
MPESVSDRLRVVFARVATETNLPPDEFEEAFFNFRANIVADGLKRAQESVRSAGLAEKGWTEQGAGGGEASGGTGVAVGVDTKDLAAAALEKAKREVEEMRVEMERLKMWLENAKELRDLEKE